MIKSWVKGLFREKGASRNDRMPLLSEEEFRSLEKIVVSPGDGTDAVARFTQDFARYLGVQHGVAVNSGTSALEVAVAAAGIGPGDEVIVPSYSFYSTVSAVLKARARPVYVDVRLEDGCIDPEEVRKAVTGNTRAVIAVHLAGAPADLDSLLDLCRRRGLTLIEDVAQGVGSEWRGRKLGSFGAMGCFSFQASKSLAAGEGGFIATNDERLFSLCSAFSNVGISPSGTDGDHVLLGGNYRLPYLEAAILSILIEKLEDRIGRTEASAAILTESLEGLPGITTPVRPRQATRINHHFYGFRYDRELFGGLPKAGLISRLRNEGLPCEGGYPIPLYAHAAFRNLSVPLHHPNTLALCEETVGFGQDFLLEEAQKLRHAVDVIQRLCQRHHGVPPT